MMKSLIFSACAVTLMGNAANATEAKVISVDDEPLQITGFSSSYEPAGTYTRRDQVSHKVSLQNISGKPIVAYTVTFQLFDAFNESLGRGLNGFALDAVPVDGETYGNWSQDPSAAFKFERYGTSVAYVSKVRFEDGVVWKADLSEVLDELQDIESSLTIDAIEPVTPE